MEGLDPEKRNGLILAVMGDYRDIVYLLLEKEANVNHKDKNGKSALQYAAVNDKKPMCLLLLLFGADSRFTDEALKNDMRTFFDTVSYALNSDQRRGAVLPEARPGCRRSGPGQETRFQPDQHPHPNLQGH